MQWALLKSVLLAAPAAAALTFEPPFQLTDWVLTGDARVVEDNVELVHASGQAGSVWGRAPVPYPEWTLEAVLYTKADFLADAGTSGYALWYTKTPIKEPTPPSFKSHGGPNDWDGLGVMVDGLANGVGAVRGHLNDGTTRFSDLADVEANALSLCRINYRQAASPITIRVGYSERGFVVSVNGQKCFQTTEITLPGGYFGVSANSDSTTDVLSVQRLSVSPGMSPDLVQLLPGHDDANTDKEPVKDKATKDSAKDPVKDPLKDAVYADVKESVEARAADASGVTEKLLPLLQPTLDRVELMDQRLKQVQSALDQLADTLSLSMSQITEAGARQGGAAPDTAGLQKEILNLRTQVADWHKGATAAAPGPGPAPAGPSMWALAAVLVPSQLLAVAVYHAWLKRRERHGKLL